MPSRAQRERRDRRRALELLAGSADGCTEALMLAHGLRIALLVGLINAGLASATTDRVVAGGVVVGRIFNSAASPVGTPWMWTLAFGYQEDRTPTHGYEPTREAAMAAFAKSWRRE